MQDSQVAQPWHTSTRSGHRTVTSWHWQELQAQSMSMEAVIKSAGRAIQWAASTASLMTEKYLKTVKNNKLKTYLVELILHVQVETSEWRPQAPKEPLTIISFDSKKEDL